MVAFRMDGVARQIARQAESRPAALALIEGERRMDFAALDGAVRHAAAALRAQGLRRGEVVALAVEDALLYMVAAVALAGMGVPHIAFSPREAPRVKESLARRVRAVAVVGDAAETATGLPLIEPDPAWLEAGGGDAPPLPPAVPAETLFFRHTSGTTGQAKIVATSQQDFLHHMEREWTVISYPPGEIYYTPVSVHFTAAHSRILFCLCRGGTALLSSRLPDAAAIAELLDRHQVRIFSGVPLHAFGLLEQASGAGPRFPALRCLRLGATEVGERLRSAVRERLSPNLYVNYGSIESNNIAIATPALLRECPDSVGMPTLEVQVVDDAGRVLPPGERGEVRVRGPGVAQGYLDDAEASALAFRGGWFHPGDIGALGPNGALYVHGRADDMMIHEGVNIYPAEIERILERHEAVIEAVAVPLRSPESGQVPVAAVVLRRDIPLDELMKHCREWLGSRAPARLARFPRLPRNAMGKIDRKAIAREFGRALGAAGR